MIFFGKKKTTKQNNVELLGNKNGTTVVAFGLQWVPLVTSGSKDAVFANARKQGATHINSRPQQIGYGTIDTKQHPTIAGVRIFAAAQVAARSIGGDAIVALNLGEGTYWLAVVRGGKPSSIDKIIQSSNPIQLVEEVERHHDLGDAEGTKFRIFTNLEHHNFQAVNKFDPAELLRNATNADDEFILIPADKRRSIPKPVMYALMAVLGIVLANEAYNFKVKNDRERAKQLNLAAVNEPSEVVWLRALKEWEATHAKPSTAGLLAVRVSIDPIPVYWYGWTQDDIVCAASPFISGAQVQAAPAAPGTNSQTSATAQKAVQNWSCIGKYTRQPEGITSGEMATLVPVYLNFSSLGVDKFAISWTVQTEVEAMSIAEIKPLKEARLELTSLFELHTPSMEKIAVDYAPVPIQPPKKSDGTVYAADASIPQIKSAPLTVKAPLRTLDKLLASGLTAEWKSLTLTPSKLGPGSADQSTVNRSSLSVSLIGAVYAKGN